MYGLFYMDARLSVKIKSAKGEYLWQFGINFLYCVQWNGKIRDVKVQTYYKALEEGVGPFVQDRNALEADVICIMGAITPEYIPEVIR